jgi:DNA polymerase-3 subunit gamma/tau
MKESVAIEEAALASIARAAEGSVRDALSLLDQAIAHGMGDAISKASVNTMLGLADRGKIIDLFETVMSGNMASALALIKDLYDSGADPAQVLIELAEFVHLLTRFKLVPAAAKDMSLTEDERQRGAEFAASLGVPILTRAWQILLKGLQEVKGSDRPLAAAEMVLVRLAYAADLPTPDEVLRELKGLPPQVKPEAARPGPSPARPSPNSEAKLKPAEALQPKLAAAASPKASLALAPLALTSIAAEGENDQPRRRYHSFSDIVALAGERRDLQLKRALEQDVHLVRFEEGAFEFSPGPGASPGLAQALSRKLAEWTGFRWIVALSREKGAPSLQQMAEAQTEDEMALARRDPLVQSVLKHFPGAEIIAVRPVKQDNILEPSLLPEDEGADEIGFADMIEPDDDL